VGMTAAIALSGLHRMAKQEPVATLDEMFGGADPHTFKGPDGPSRERKLAQMRVGEASPTHGAAGDHKSVLLRTVVPTRTDEGQMELYFS
jgi:hypothetical protein